MATLWAPWRIDYVRKPKKIKGCIFCRASKKNYKGPVILKAKYSTVLLNIFPYNNGHLMAAPRRHVRDTRQLNDVEMLDLYKTVDKAIVLLDKTLKPHGYNIGINLGKVAGAGIPGHLHIHIVPRWRGDTNFMPVISGAKVISQSLKELQRQLTYVKPKTG